MNNYNFDYYQYKQRINPKPKLHISVCVVIIIILTGLAFALKQNNSTIDFHFVETGNFINYKDANSHATELKQQNAGGYIYFDGTYHVLACAYLNEKDAKSVASNLSSQYEQSKYFSLSTRKFNAKSLTKTEQNAIIKVINANEKIINDYYSLTLNNQENPQLSLKLAQLHQFYIKETEDFLSLFKVNNKISTLNEKISTIQDCLNENLDKYTMKYNLIKISITHYSFLEFFCWFFFSLIIITNCQIPRPIKKTAKNFFKTALSTWFAIIAPIRLKTQPTAASNHVSLNATSLFFEWITSATIDIGKKATKLTPWALNCS